MSDDQNIEEFDTPSLEKSFLLKERFEIRFDYPLSELDANGAKAYEVKDNINPQRHLFALICGQETSPRLSYLPYMKSIDVPNILKLVEYGTVSYEGSPETIALIYNKPTGPRADVFRENNEAITPETFRSLVLSIFLVISKVFFISFIMVLGTIPCSSLYLR